eukprot:TRINITY_DN26006_c0_g1_i1.p1 TRINITY_DN26006_c0_g1~~TRINITY_DN26006_c0_g1_i1.p1  ORF type:complete len:522 (-),score=143.41 TRINITY_DN26006_c0_g1_i1:332-1897(-)
MADSSGGQQFQAEREQELATNGSPPMSSSTAIVPFAATGAAAEVQALADERMRPTRVIAFPGSAVGEVRIEQLPGTALGAYAWRAGVELVTFLERTLGDQLKGLRILELGSGTGITAVALARLGAVVVATDCMPDLVRLARRNMKANELDAERCTAHLYEWGAPRLARLRAHFDLVVASEVTALSSGHAGLLATLQSFAAGEDRPRIFMAETRRNAEQPRFWQLAEADFEATEVAQIAQSDSWNTLGREEPVRIFEMTWRSSEKVVAPAPTPATTPWIPQIAADVAAAAAAASTSLAWQQPYEEIFHTSEKLDPFSMSMEDMEEFKARGFAGDDIGKLSTYGCVLHTGVYKLFEAIAEHAFGGDIRAALHDKVFVDLGSAEGRCVISAAMHFDGGSIAAADDGGGIAAKAAVAAASTNTTATCEAADGTCQFRPRLKRAVGVELSGARHDLAVKYRARIADEDIRNRVELVRDDIFSEESARLLTQADVVYAANLRFPEEVNGRLGAHVAACLDPAKAVGL